MKITLKQLKNVIKEEVNKLSEDNANDLPGHERMELTQAIHQALEICDRIGVMKKGDKSKHPQARECAKHLIAAWNSMKGVN
jgi:hypothetical protein